MEGRRTIKSRVLSHGFKKGFSIATNAQLHRNRRYVFNVDLKDFFPSVNFGRVRGFFINDRNFSLNPKIATILAQIACHENRLPQGSPCSPVVSNLITHILDLKLNKLANDARCTYSRYADDITFSTNEKVFPAAIGRLVRGSDDKWVAGDDVVRLVYRAGFKVNHDKTRMQYRDSRQDVTGLIVNKKINVRREYLKQTRAMCHHLFNYGYFHCISDGEILSPKNEVLRGRLDFIYHIMSRSAAGLSDGSGIERLYSRFLDYSSFYGIHRPRVICEGKTDNIYIKSAIKKFGLKYPLLFGASGENPLKIDFFNYSDKTAKLQGLSGGGGELSKLLSSYRVRTRYFKHGAIQPTIIVVDNDSGSKGIFKHLTNILGEDVDGSEPYYHVYENLYVIPIPKVNAAIEDLFEPEVLQRKLDDGRSFTKSNKDFDIKKYFGKNEMATRIIAPERDVINFDGFKPFLEAITLVIANYHSVIQSSVGGDASPALSVAA